MFKKGDVVRVKGTVFADYGANPGLDLIHDAGDGPDAKSLYRFPADFVGIVIGLSWRNTGHLIDGGYREPNGFCVDKRHPVWIIEEIDTLRYFKPVACLEADLERVSPGDSP